jgi:hypothetical protein
VEAFYLELEAPLPKEWLLEPVLRSHIKQLDPLWVDHPTVSLPSRKLGSSNSSNNIKTPVNCN